MTFWPALSHLLARGAGPHGSGRRPTSPNGTGRGGVSGALAGKEASGKVLSPCLQRSGTYSRASTHAMPAAGSELPRPPSPPPAQEQGAEPRPQHHGELQYLGQIEHILRCGFRKDDRTGTGTLSVFGMQARYSLRGDAGWRRAAGERARCPRCCGGGGERAGEARPPHA